MGSGDVYKRQAHASANDAPAEEASEDASEEPAGDEATESEATAEEAPATEGAEEKACMICSTMNAADATVCTACGYTFTE